VRSNQLSYRPVLLDPQAPGGGFAALTYGPDRAAASMAVGRFAPGGPERAVGVIPARRGGAGRDRTDDPLLAKQVLSQLSYGPKGSLVWRKGYGTGGMSRDETTGLIDVLLGIDASDRTDP
jgi:hypothetical protein